MSKTGDVIAIVSDNDEKLGECYMALVESDFDVGLGVEFDCIHVDLAFGSTGSFFKKLNSLSCSRSNLARAKIGDARHYLIRIS